MLKKLSENDREYGHSALNFVITVVTIMVLCCGFLDMVNLIRLKSVVTQQANMYSAACMQQGGFKKEIPADWKAVFGNGCTNYITKSKAVSTFKTAISHTNGIDNSCSIVLKTSSGTYNLANANSDVILNWEAKGTLSCSVEYRLDYLDAFGLLTKKFKCTTTNDVTGFWIHKNTAL